MIRLNRFVPPVFKPEVQDKIIESYKDVLRAFPENEYLLKYFADLEEAKQQARLRGELEA